MVKQKGTKTVTELDPTNPEAIDPGIQLDWHGYFKAFCETHGQPVMYQKRLLFPDGWTYAADNPAGPEYRPPEDNDKLNRLKQEYWKRRLKILHAERLAITNKLEMLRKLQASKGAQLYYYALEAKTDDDGREYMKPKSMPLDLDDDNHPLVGRYLWLSAQVEIADSELDSLTMEVNHEGSRSQ